VAGADPVPEANGPYIANYYNQVSSWIAERKAQA
jgi:hypothetical protein